jgi:tetratricopeptide (TPR) repeat protein
LNGENIDFFKGYYRMGMVYLVAEEYDQANEAFKSGLTLDPNDDNCKRALQRIEENQIKLNVRKSIMKGKLSFEKEEYEMSIDYFNDAISLNPRNATYYVYRSIAYMAAKKINEGKIFNLQFNDFANFFW